MGGVSAGHEMAFPPKNTWVPDNFKHLNGLDAAIQAETVTAKPLTYPTLITTSETPETPETSETTGTATTTETPSNKIISSNVETWYKLDDTFGEPRGAILLEMHTEKSTSSIRQQILIELLSKVLDVTLREPLYAASKTGLSYDISTDSRYLFKMNIIGYNQYLPRFFSTVVNRTLTVITDSNSEQFYEKRFQLILDR